jgi:hypothetical protein
MLKHVLNRDDKTRYSNAKEQSSYVLHFQGWIFRFKFTLNSTQIEETYSHLKDFTRHVRKMTETMFLLPAL